MEQPIIFSGAEVRAYLEGRKSQTRRLNGLKLVNQTPDDWQCERYTDTLWRFGRRDAALFLKCPYRVGARLWVRETWAYTPCSSPGERMVLYKADSTSSVILQRL